MDDDLIRRKEAARIIADMIGLCRGDVLREASLALDRIPAVKQVPHIITIQDFINNPDVDENGNLPAWQEIRRTPGIAYDRDGWVVLNRNRAEGWFNSSVIRFWTSQPTKEQSEAVPW